MSQSTPTLDNIGYPQARTKINDVWAAFLSQHRGASRPSYAVAGTFWVSTADVVYYYDGADDIPLYVIDSTNNTAAPYNKGAAWGGVSTGAANAQVVAFSPAITAWQDGLEFAFQAGFSNTGAATLNAGAGATAMRKASSSGLAALASGDLIAGNVYKAVYNGTYVVILNPQPSTVSGTADVGDVKFTAGATTGSGWLLCYGQAVSRTTYADLFALIGTTYGTGDGSTTFNLPDGRGRVAAGQDDMGGSSANRLTGLTDGVNGDTLGATGGLESTAIAKANLPTDPLKLPRATSGSGSNAFLAGGSPSYDVNSQAMGSGTAINNVQPTIILNMWIYAGV